MNVSDYPYLIGLRDGHAAEQAVEIENTPEKIAAFICEAGQEDDLVISTPDWERVLNTFGFYIDRCQDQGFLQVLLKVLIPMQKEIEVQAGLPECGCCGDTDEA